MNTVSHSFAVDLLNGAARMHGIVLDQEAVKGMADRVAADIENPANWDGDRPMTDDQRNALFAAFMDAFGTNDRTLRYRFTLSVLGRDVVPSWSREGSLTFADASRLLDVLHFVNEEAI